MFNISTEEPNKQKWKINPDPDTKNKNNVYLKILQKPPPPLPLPPLMSTRVDIITSCNKHQKPRGDLCIVSMRHVGILVTWLDLNGSRGIFKRHNFLLGRISKLFFYKDQNLTESYLQRRVQYLSLIFNQNYLTRKQ